MVLKLYGVAYSSCTRRVGVVLQEKQVPFEFVEVDHMQGEHKSPSYLEKQPFGKFPYLDDEGFILYESRAIAEYIALKYPEQGTELVPTDLKALALSKQAASIEVSGFNDLAERALIEKLYKPMFGLETDQAVFDKLIDDLSSKLDVYDKILSKQKYLAGNEITLADLYHLPYTSMLARAGRPDVIDTRPNVLRWFKDISSRPSWQAVKDGVKSTA